MKEALKASRLSRLVQEERRELLGEALRRPMIPLDVVLCDTLSNHPN